MLCCLIITMQTFVSAEGVCIVTTTVHLHSVSHKTLDAAIYFQWFPHSQARSARLVTIPLLKENKTQME